VTNTSEVVILAAEVDEPKLDNILFNAEGFLRYVKLRRDGLQKMGFDKIEAVEDLGFQVFADAKISGIPDEVVAVASDYLKYHPWMLNCMANDCSSGFMQHDDPKKVDGLKRFAFACHMADTRPCAVTVFTSKSPEMVAREFNGRSVNEQVLVYAEMLLDAGFTDLVCSPLEAAAIRSESRFDRLDLNTPGVRLPGSDHRDQARVATPIEAIAVGATRLVIGSDLINGNFVENFQKINANLNP
jgi:orotidine-5'-phosphate decarboxylase